MKTDNLHLTFTSMSRVSLPASFCAIHLYVPLCDLSTRSIVTVLDWKH